jgi:tetratricopeptide (TPR) repeat protein
MRYRGSDKPLPAIARELGVGLVLTGSVMRAGGQVRITTELVQADPEEQLWAESYQRNLRDVLALQGEVAQEVARQVRLELTDQEKRRLSAARTVDPVAYDFYLQGRFHWEKRTRGELEKAIGYFEKAIARDPEYAAAHAGLADAHALLGYFRHEPPETAFPKARAEVNRALALDPDLAEAHASLGYLKLVHDWDGAGSEAELRRALALNPSYASGHHWLALHLSSVGRLEEAGEHFRTARQLNPFSPTVNTAIGTHLLSTGDVNGSIEQCRKAIDLEPQYAFAYDNLWIVLDAAGRLDEAFTAYEKVLSLRGDSDLARSARRIYARSGYREALARTGDELAAAGPAQLGTLIQSYVLAGENAKALTWLEQALERRDPLLLWLRYTAHWRRLQGEPRFRKLLAQVDRLRSRDG